MGRTFLRMTVPTPWTLSWRHFLASKTNGPALRARTRDGAAEADETAALVVDERLGGTLRALGLLDDEDEIG